LSISGASGVGSGQAMHGGEFSGRGGQIIWQTTDEEAREIT
jgi:hypothetical protein